MFILKLQNLHTFGKTKVPNMPVVNPITQTEFSRIFLQYHHSFQMAALRYVRSVSVAEDLVAESFLTSLENMDNLSADDNVPAYIFTIVKNKCVNWLRQEKRKLEIAKQMHSTYSLTVQNSIRSLEICNPDKLFSHEISEIVSDSLKKMPEITQRIFFAIRKEGKSYKEVAQDNGITTTRVNYEMSRVMKILRIALADFLCMAWILKYVAG